MNLKTFDFLIPTLDEWLTSKWETAFQSGTLDFTEEEFIKKFVEPYKGYNLEELEIIAKEQTRLSPAHLGKIVLFNVNIGKQTHYNAIEWTMINIAELNLDGLDFLKLREDDFEDYCNNYIEHKYYDTMLFLKDFTIMPENQCHFCGQPDKDTTGSSFNLKRKFCHLSTCTVNDANLDGHDEDCCFRRWKTIKKYYRQKLKRIMKSTMIKTLNDKEERVREIFWNFCEERYKTNLKILYSVQIDNHKAEKITKYQKQYV